MFKDLNSLGFDDKAAATKYIEKRGGCESLPPSFSPLNTNKYNNLRNQKSVWCPHFSKNGHQAFLNLLVQHPPFLKAASRPP
jgi:hypothetical protein